MRRGQGTEVSELVLAAARNAEASPSGRAAFERYVSPTALEQRGQLGYAHEIVYIAGVPAGMIETKGVDHISMLYIHPSYANRGIGSRLIARAAFRCALADPKVKFMTVHATDDAVDFYERVGFTRSGSRKEVGGIFSTPCRLTLRTKGNLVPSKLYGSSVELFVFTGTGNSLLVAQAVGEVLRQEGLEVRLRSMDDPAPETLPEEAAVGLAFPVACFSTYPTVWRFLRSLPPGEGREVFMLGTNGGAPGGMQGPLRRVLRERGYKTVAARFFVMPGNYNNRTMPIGRNAARVEKALLEARFFAYDLLQGRTHWSGGIPLLSGLIYRLGQTRKPWNAFYKWFPISADREKCTRCGRCAQDCPEKAIEMNGDGYPTIDGKICESCQRCVGFCPTGALHVPAKPAEPYRAMSYEEFRAAFR